MENQALENCPFCGSRVAVNLFVQPAGPAYIACSNAECGMAGPTHKSEAQAIRWWNRFVTRALICVDLARAVVNEDEALVRAYFDRLDSIEPNEWRK